MSDERHAADRGAAQLDEFAHANVRFLSRNAPPIAVCTAEELLALELPPREVLMSPWLTQKSLTLIHAARGVGKTYVGLGIAGALASGGDFLNWKVSRPISVFYLDGEMAAEAMQARMRQQNRGAPRVAPFGFYLADRQTEGTLNLSDPRHQASLEPHLVGYEVIVVDNLSCLCRGGAENEAESWNPVQEWLIDQRRRGRSVILLHHDGKNGQQRGTSKREDILDTVMHLRQPSDYSAEQGARFEVHYRKHRHFLGDDAKPFEATLTVVGNETVWIMKSVDDSNYERVIDLTRQGLAQVDIAQELRVERSTVSRAVKRAEKERRLP